MSLWEGWQVGLLDDQLEDVYSGLGTVNAVADVDNVDGGYAARSRIALSLLSKGRLRGAVQHWLV